MSRIKFAFFDFTDCEGCQLQIVNLNTALVELLQHIEIVRFREAMSEEGDDYNVAVVEGSICGKHDIGRITEIRRRAKVVVALGACAATAGVNKIIAQAPKDIKGRPFNSTTPRPLDKIIKVDYYIHGCPVYLPEVVEVFKAVLLGKRYAPPNYPVCLECKMNENVCVYDKGQNCLGPLTRAGCNCWCVNNGNICYGCRGYVDNPAQDAQEDILRKYGLSAEEIKRRFSLYGQG